MTTTPRPTLTSNDALAAYAEKVVEAGVLGVAKPDPSTLVPVFQAHPEDAYLQACALEGLGYAVSEETVVRLASMRRTTLEHVLRALTTAWVLEEGVRFPAKEGDEVSATDPVSGMTAARKVIGVIASEAYGFVTTPSGPVRINAEDVASVWPADGGYAVAANAVRQTVGFQVMEEAVGG